MGKPKIRFNGYTEDWEQRKVSEITSSYSGGTPKAGTAEYYDGDIPFIRSGEIYSDTTELFITEEGLNSSSAKMVHVGDILYALYGATSGEVSRARLEGAINQAILAIIPNDDVNADFLVEWFRKEKAQITDKYLQGGQGNLSAQIIKDLGVTIPTIEEQNKIGEYFSMVNHLITLHQRKCEETKTLKKYMLQKMFPQNGQSVPEIRFSGFTEDWEQRKLNEYLNVSTTKNRDNHYGKEDVLSVSGDYGIVNQIEFQGRSFAGASVANYGVVDTGDVVYTKSPLSTNPYGIIKTNKGKSGIVSTLYAVYKPRENVNPEFVQIYFELNSRMNNYMQPLVNKGAKNDMKVTAENALKGGVCFPNLKEQNAIVDYFSSLDRLITLHQRKCEELQEIKKYMLQNMFV